MDFDDIDEPAAASKPAVRKFQPKGKGKIPAQPKKEPAMTDVKPESAVKPEPVLKPKAEPMDVVDEGLGRTEMVEDKEVLSMGIESQSGVNGAANVVSGVDFEVVQNEAMEIDEDEEDDPVVREIDVYFMPQIDENTENYLVQYPLRPSWRPYDFENCLKEVMVKPTSAKVEMDLEVELGNRNPHDSFSGVNTMPLKLTSTTTRTPKAGHCIGLLKSDKLFLTPVHAIVQLRPSTNSDDDEDEDDGTKKLENIDQKQPAALSKNQGKSVPSPAQNMNNKESWVPLKYHGPNSDVAESCLQKLTTASANPSPMPPTLSPREYLNALCPRRPNEHRKSPIHLIRSILSLSLPLEERFKKWFLETHKQPGGEPAFRFSVLKHLAPEEPAEKVIEILEKQAVLIQGVWVPKTSIVLHGRPPKEALARDYLLLKFSKKITIADEELRFKRDMNMALIDVLRKLATKRDILKDWKFKTPPDPSFSKLYPYVAKQQGELWETREPVIMRQINDAREGSMKLVSNSTPRTSNSAPTKKLLPLVPPAKKEALLKALAVLFKNHAVNSLETICRGLRDMAVSASSDQRTVDNSWKVVAASCVDSRDELECVLSDFAVKIHDRYVARSSMNHPELFKLRDVVIKLFLAQPVNGKLKKANIMEAFKIHLNQDVTNNDYTKVMTELCETSGSAWVLRSPGR